LIEVLILIDWKNTKTFIVLSERHLPQIPKQELLAMLYILRSRFLRGKSGCNIIIRYTTIRYNTIKVLTAPDLQGYAWTDGRVRWIAIFVADELNNPLRAPKWP
jgi:hypothetical protein